MSQIDKRIQVNKIIENQLPDYLVADFPNAVELFKQYYISQEYQGGPNDLISNLDQYIKVDNLVPEVVVGVTTITSAVSSSDTTISVPSTKGFPSEYGLLKIGDEIITYTGITTNTFTGCVRGFSGVTGYNVGITSSLNDVNKENLVFEDTVAAAHVNGTSVTNLSVLFLQEFYKKLKRTFLPGLENNKFTDKLDVGNFVKFARSFYQSKGIEESIRILMKVLYGVEAKVLDLEDNLIKPSDAEFIRREIVIADRIGTGDPTKLVGQTIFKSTDLRTNASVSEVEPITREGKTYFKLSLFVGYSDRDLIEGTFTVPGNTKVIEPVSVGSSIIDVDSTIGFGKTGTVVSGENVISYTSKSVNQFFGCSGVASGIGTADNLRSNEVVFGYADGDLNKKVELRITGVLSKFLPVSDISLVKEGERVYVRNIGEKIENPGVNQTYKEIFANSWIYNTSSKYEVSEINGSTFSIESSIDRSSLRLDDRFAVVKRGSHDVEIVGTVSNIDKNLGQITLANLGGWTPVVGQYYDIRRVLKKASSSGVSISLGNDNIISDVLNVYTDGETDGYVASNSLPSYNISAATLKESIPVADSTNLYNQGTNNLYSEIGFPGSGDIKFIQGDPVVYTCGIATQPMPGLVSGQTYYVDTIDKATPSSRKFKIKLYQSIGQIGTINSVSGITNHVQFGTAPGSHTFTLLNHYNRTLRDNRILRKIPLSQNHFVTGKGQTPVNDLGILIDGVEIRSQIPDDNIFFGPITSIDMFNGGKGYDVVNPPQVVVDDSIIRSSSTGAITGYGTTALIQPVLEGTVKEVLVDPQDFDIDKVKTLTLTGGNGTGCILEPVMGPRFRELEFDSRDIFFAGGVSIADETITFTTSHNLAEGEKVFYSSNGNDRMGIGVYKDPGNTITGTLANGAPYHVGIVNDQTIQLYPSENDALSGINTIGLSTDTNASGIHKFRTTSKNTLKTIRVLNSGSGYQNRKLNVRPSGISTAYNTINFVNHGFNSGDLIEYAPTIGVGTSEPKAIEGLSTSKSYYIMKVDNNSFRLADAGIGGTSRIDYNRKKVVGLTTTGTGYQTFKYPDIQVKAEVSYGSTVTGTFNFTPIVTGEVIDAYLYEEGSEYGSTILNHHKNPAIIVKNGKEAELKPIVVDGKIVDVVVMNKGKEYYSIPEINVVGSGNGALFRPVISNGQLTDIIVINSGIGYTDANSTNVYADARGHGALFEPRVRKLTVNNTERLGRYHLAPEGTDSLGLSILGYNQELASIFKEPFTVDANGDFNEINGHSPIIGWSYDGNPIYGPFGYTDPDDINSPLKILQPGYVKDSSKITNRPVGFSDGFFIEDYIFDGSGDLDTHNGRFCKTPEFPNGVYAYFAAVEIGSGGELEPKYPYFVGNTYKSPVLEENITLTQEFDFNNSNLLRNTLPYKVGDEHADNDFIIESSERIRQFSTIESVTMGNIDNVTVLDGGDNYQIGDFTVFDDSGTNGSGLRAQVDEIVGIAVSTIQTTQTRYQNAVLTWKNSKEVIANYTLLEMNDKDTVKVSGLSTSIVRLADSFAVGVKTEQTGLAKTMSVATGSAVINDIYVDHIPNTVSIGGTLKVGDELLKILNVDSIGKIVRVQRYGGSTAIGHTYGSNIDVLNQRITIPVNTPKFESKVNDLVYFNAPQSVGVGTTSGGGIDVKYHNGEIVKDVYIPTRTIYLPKHPFKAGQRVSFSMNPGANPLNVSNSPVGNQFQIPNTTTSVDDVYIVDKGEDYIGIVTTAVGIGSTSEGLYLRGTGSQSGISSNLYLLTSNYTQITGDIDRLTSTITTKVAAALTTTHGLQNGDVVKMNVIPSVSVGIGSTAAVSVSYNKQYEKLLFNPIDFTSSAVKTNKIDLDEHGLKTGDKVFYDGSATGLSTGSYYVYRINDDNIQLGETYVDVTANPANTINITNGTGGANQSISLINPQITIVKNNQLTFSLSTSTLQGFDFKLFYDKEFKNEFLSAQDSSIFNVSGIGTIGIGTGTSGVGAALTVKYSDSMPMKIYYALEKSGYISTTDTDVVNYNEISFVDSAYSGEFKIFNKTVDTFDISPRKVPEFLSYKDTDCDKIEYSTRSTSVKGPIKDLKIISKGFNYKSLPKFSSVTSIDGKNANVVAVSTSVGRINNVRIMDIGYEYPADKTLSPEAYVSPVANLDNLDIVQSVTVVDGGQEYLSAPDLIVQNPETNVIVDEVSLKANVPNQSISTVDIFSPLNGLDSVQHRIIAINNSNGVGIQSMTGGITGIVTCVLETPINGFITPPFKVGDEIFVENIQLVGQGGIGTQGGVGIASTNPGTGYNSKDYNYQFFEITDYANSNPAVLKYNLSGLTINPGIAKTYQSGYATIVNKNKYPILEPVQVRGTFDLGEKLNVDQGTGVFVETDLSIVESRDDYIKVDGFFELLKGHRIQGTVSNILASITSFVQHKAKYTVDYSSRQDYGWIDDIGKLNEDNQVVPNNDYYQNLSYSIKSSIEWEKLVDPINRLVHPSGLKNFADLGVQSTVNVGVSYGGTTNNVVILDVINPANRVDAIENFDVGLDYDTRANKSKFFQVSNTKLTDYTLCKTNRVLIHDEISNQFSSKGLADTFTEIEELGDDFANYLVQIVDPDTFDTQLTELVVLSDTDNAYLLEKTTDYTTLELGEFDTDVDSFKRKTLRFTPKDKFTKDHDIKILKTDFNTDNPTTGATAIGAVDLTSSNIGVGTAVSGFTTETIAQFANTDFNACYAQIHVKDKNNGEVNYNEVIIDFDGTDTYIAETYTDASANGYSASRVGIITAKYEGGNIKIQCINDRAGIGTELNVRANIVGLGTTTAGIGTYTYTLPGQPIGAERSARLESTYVTGPSGIGLTFSTIDKTIDSSVKSLVRVSCGETSAIHQVIAVRDIDDIVTVQYPFVSAGSTTGIGTFSGVITGDNINLKFHPDTEWTSTVEVQAYSQIFYTANDFINEPDDLKYGGVTKELVLSAYDGLNGNRANRTSFELTHEGVPIYSKTVNPAGITLNSDTLTIPDHFYNTYEELEYNPKSTFIGVAATAISIGSTANVSGIVTTILPERVFVRVVDEDRIQLFSQVGFVSTGNPITYTGLGSGNAHTFEMNKKLTKTIIGLDGIVQQPITFTGIGHSLDGAIGVGVSQFALTGISSVQPRDVLKVDEEYMKVTQVGFASLPAGTINDSTDVALGISTIPVVKVIRGSLGIGATPHTDDSVVQLHRGSFNIVDSKVHFLDPPKGNTRERRSLNNLPYVKAEFSGRTFLRSNYTSNMLFDDISDKFTGIGRTYTLSVGGAHTSTGVQIGNGILFINGVFQTPRTINNAGNNYEFENDVTAGVSSVRFTGITSVNGQFIKSDYDINQNQLPRGGMIVSLGSTPGLGYAPLVGANVKAFKDTNENRNSINSLVGIGTSSGVSLGIQTAAYDSVTGIITVTTNTVHGFSLGDPKLVKLKDLEFSCATQHAGVTTTIFSDHDRPLFLVGIVSERSIEVDAGICTIPHNYMTGGNVYEFYNDLVTGSGYREPVAIGVSDTEYIHKFVSSNTNSITSQPGGAQFTPTAANYTSSTGELDLTIGNHNLQGSVNHNVTAAEYDARVGVLTATINNSSITNGTPVKFAPNSLKFKCTMDGNTSEKSYPRSSDPTSNDWLNVSNVSTSGSNATFEVNVGSSSRVTFTPTDADYDPVTGLMELTIGAHSLKPGTSIRLVANSLSFTCDVDNNTSTKTYPRSSDPFYNTAINIESVTDTTITLQVLSSAPSTNITKHTFVTASNNCVISGGALFAHTFQSAEANAVSKALNWVTITNNSLSFTCSRDNYRGAHTYPRSTDPASGVNIGIAVTSDKAITVNVGAGGGGGKDAVVTAKVATNKHKFVSATAGAAFTGGNYAHIFVPGSENTNAVAINAWSGTKLTPTAAVYTPATGSLVLTVGAGHGITAGSQTVGIATNSLTFTCERDKHLTEHTYPRVTDRIHNLTNVAVSATTTNSITVNVGASPIVTRNITDADYNPATGWLQVTSNAHGFVGVTTLAGTGVSGGITNAAYNKNTGVLTITKASHGFNVGDKILIEDYGITFSCTKDGNATNHSYPRPTDYASGKWLAITAKTVNTFKVNVNPTPSASRFDHTYVSSTNGCILKANQTVGIATNSLTFTCAQDDHRTDHAYPRLGNNHKFVSAASNSVTVGTWAGAKKTPTNATYDGTTGDLVLTIAGHGLNTSNTIGIATDGITFTCDKDNYSTLHPYPRNTDPIHNLTNIAIRSTTTNTITVRVGTSGEADLAHRVELPVGRVGTNWFRINVGKSPAGTGGALDLSINKVGGHYVNPVIEIPDPVYQNIPVEGISRLGIGLTVATGENLLMNLEVGAATTAVGIGSTFFQISDFQTVRHGHSFKIGDKFRPVGLVHDKRLQKPLDQFELEVIEIFRDYFSAWQFGEIDFIDSISLLQDGNRRRFPLFFNGQLLSFEKDNTNAVSQQIDLDSVLIIFVNGVLQTPKYAYQFNGGTTFTFTEAPDTGDKVDVFFYKGEQGVDVEIVDIEETLKIGDDIEVFKHPDYTDTVTQERKRVIKDLLGVDLVETDIYSGLGIDENNEKPIRWTKQKSDKIIKGEVIAKSRSSIEPQIHPTAKIIGNLTGTSGIGQNIGDGIFVDDAHSFRYEDNNNPDLDATDRYGLTINYVDSRITSGEITTPASLTANVSAAGTVTVNVVDGGSGYVGTSASISIAAPVGVGVGTDVRTKYATVGVTTFAEGLANVANGVITSVNITNPGLGYTLTNPPSVIAENPPYEHERVTGIKLTEGFSGIITSIDVVSGTAGMPKALKFCFRADKNASILQVGYPILITDTKVGTGITSIDTADASTIGLGTQFLDNVYKVHARLVSGNENGEVTCNILSTTNTVGLATTGFYDGNAGLTTSLGRISWGRLYGNEVKRAASPIAIGVTGYTVNAGLTTFPTIQRKNYTETALKGLRSTGAIRVFGLS